MNSPHWNPVRDIGSPRNLWCRDTKHCVLVGGVLLGRGAAVRALRPTCAPSPCASKVSRKLEAFPLRGLGPPRTERGRGVASVGRSGLAKVLQIIFGWGGSESVYASLSLNRSGRMGSLRTEPHQAVVSWFRFFITRSCMHGICVFWCWMNIWKLERRNRARKQKLQVTHRERRRVPRKTVDGVCRDSWSGMVGVQQTGSDGKPWVFSIFRAKRFSRKVINV